MSTMTTPADTTITPSYELAEGFNPEALVEALANLDSVCREVEEYLEADEKQRRDPAENWTEDISDEVHDAGMALANLLADGGQLNDQDELAWLDDEGKQVFAWSLEEVIRKSANWALSRLAERYPTKVHAEVERFIRADHRDDLVRS